MTTLESDRSQPGSMSTSLAETIATHGPLTKPAIEALAADPSACDIASIEESIARLAIDTAAAKLVARALRRLPLPCATVAAVYPHLGYSSLAVSLIAIAEGDRGRALLELVERDAFPEDHIGASLAVVAVIGAWRLCAPFERPRILRSARLLSAWVMGLPSDCWQATEALGRFAQECGDAVLAAMVAPPSGRLCPDLMTLELSLASAEDPYVMATKFVASVDPGHPLRAALLPPKKDLFKRNQPCPCGSGKKYKRCHGTDDGGRALPVAQRSITTLPPEAVRTIPLSDVGDIVLRRAARMLPLSLLVAGERLTKYRAWKHADVVMDEVARRDQFSPEEKDRLRRSFIEKAINGHQFALAKKHIVALRGRDVTTAAPAFETAIAIAERAPDALEHLLSVTERAATDESGALATNLMMALVRHAPGLGLLMIRGSLHLDRPDDAEMLLRRAELARLAVGLPIGDPAWDAYAALRDSERQRKDDHAAKTEAERLRESLSEASRRARDLGRRVEELEIQIRDRHRDLDHAGPRAVAKADNVDVGALRTRIDELKSLLRERNAERAALRRQLLEAGTGDAERAVLRRQLAAGTSDPDAAATVALADGSDDDVLVEPATLGPTRRILVPAFGRAAREAIGTVPAHVAALALRTIGQLAAGDPAAWRAIKQAKDMPRQVLMARIGIHHRLLFRIEEDAVEVIDLVSRGSLLVTLKRIRGAS